MIRSAFRCQKYVKTQYAKELNNDLVKINRCAYQWKISFNPEPSK